jgi:ribosomal protein S18 acetylase RimI-like enzyme
VQQAAAGRPPGRIGRVTTYDLVTEVTEDDDRALFEVYDAVFGDQPDYVAWRSGVWRRHAVREGFRLVRAYDGDRLVGFGYGYTGERGQWWTDQVATRLGHVVAAEWLGGHFELVSIGVLDRSRGTGVGRGLLERLTQGLPHDRWLLMTTAHADDPARHLYARAGWEVIGPGLRHDQVVMGRRRTTDS